MLLTCAGLQVKSTLFAKKTAISTIEFSSET